MKMKLNSSTKYQNRTKNNFNLKNMWFSKAMSLPVCMGRTTLIKLYYCQYRYSDLVGATVGLAGSSILGIRSYCTTALKANLNLCVCGSPSPMR